MDSSERKSAAAWDMAFWTGPPGSRWLISIMPMPDPLELQKSAAAVRMTDSGKQAGPAEKLCTRLAVFSKTGTAMLLAPFPMTGYKWTMLGCSSG